MLAWQAFCDCSADRQIGFGVGPIPFSSLCLWCSIHGIDGADRAYLIELVSAVDRDYLEAVAARGGS